MTNADYIRQHMTDADIALVIGNSNGYCPYLPNRAYDVWRKWALSATSNHGYISGRHGHDDPSIWYWEQWYFPDGQWKRMGRTKSVSVQVWLSMQYKPEEWEIDDET